MKYLRPLSCALIASAAVAWALPVYATDNCANGKTIYNKKVGTVEISCSQSSCHGIGVNKNKLTPGVDNPGLIDQALDSVSDMSGLRATLALTASDIDDLAAWIFYAPTCPSGGTPNLQAAPASVAFASTTVGATSPTTTVTITNSGTGAALAVTASSSDPTHFPVTANSCSGTTVGTTAGSNTCSFAVAFHPTVAGAASGTITINRTGGSITVGVSGTGGATATPGQLSMSSSISFGSQTVGTTSAAISKTITNTGGTAVAVSSLSSSNPSEFAVTSSSCGTVNAGAACTFSVTFKPGAAGSRTGSVSVVSNGTGSPQAVNVSGTGITGSAPATVTVVEYRNSGFDHYFITPVAAEIALLDARAPPFQDWSRTGFSFNAYVNATAPATSVAICRFFNSTFAPKSSHFYAPRGLGCEATIAGFRDWGLEDDKLFNSMLPDAGGGCPAGTIPVYRLYNNGMGSAPNHRFVTSLAERQTMINQGFVAEGNGIGVGMCVPP